MNNVLVLMRFAVGLLGGRLMISIWLLALAVGWGALAYAMWHPMGLLDPDRVHVEMSAMLAAMASLGGVCALTYLWNVERRYSLWQLSPGAKRITKRLCRAMALASIVAGIPTVMLRAYSSTSDRMWRISPDLVLGDPPDLKRTFSFADVPAHAYAAEAMLFLGVAWFILIVFRRTGLGLSFALLPTLIFASNQTTYRSTLGLPFAACVVVIALEFVWRRWLLSRVEDYLSRPRTESKKLRTPWLIMWRQRKAARTRGSSSVDARVAALLALPTGPTATMFSVLAVAMCFVLLPNSAAEQAPGMWALAFVSWTLAYLLTGVVARPVALPVMRLALLPIGYRRAKYGQVFLNVWWRDACARILWAACLGLVLRALFALLEWPSFLQAPVFAYGPTPAQWLLVPLAHVAGVLGIAGSYCLIASASPRVLSSANALTALPLTSMIVLMVIGLSTKWALEHYVTIFSSGQYGFLTFAVANGIVLPIIAWAANFTCRSQWRTASLPAISAGMQSWSDRLHKMSADVAGART